MGGSCLLLSTTFGMSPAVLFSILTRTGPKAVGAISGPCVLLLAAGEEPEARDFHSARVSSRSGSLVGVQA